MHARLSFFGNERAHGGRLTGKFHEGEIPPAASTGFHPLSNEDGVDEGSARARARAFVSLRSIIFSLDVFPRTFLRPGANQLFVERESTRRASCGASIRRI